MALGLETGEDDGELLLMCVLRVASRSSRSAASSLQPGVELLCADQLLTDEELAEADSFWRCHKNKSPGKWRRFEDCRQRDAGSKPDPAALPAPFRARQ